MRTVLILFTILALNASTAFGGQSITDAPTKFSAEHNGLTYYFANSADRARFVAEPERFTPAYDDYCLLDGGPAQQAKRGPGPSVQAATTPTRNVEAIWNRIQSGQLNPAAMC